MKMVKSLLLGSAAGLVAVTAGQAAELPVKAKPVQYVKICSLYGAGFYYMPGTDMCLKIGGWVRAEITDDANGSLAWGPFNGNKNNRATPDLTERARGYVTADAREETAYGVARAYIDVGINSNDVGNTSGFTSNTNRAFVQWAGFTAGLAASFYDFYPAAAQNYRAGYIPTEDTGDGGWYVWGYTAQLGNGVSATISAESPRYNQIIDVGTVAASAALSGAGAAVITAAHTGVLQGSLSTSTAGSGYGGYQVPDIVGNIRADQAWGSVQLMAAGHYLNPLYYGSTEATGAPGNSWGWVAGAGAKLNTPFITQGDYLVGEVNFTEGALKYLYSGEDTNMDNAQSGSQAWGVAADCVYNSITLSNCDRASAWSGVLSFEHHWTPQWHQSFTGGYMNVSYGSGANASLCAAEGAPGCDNDWSYWAAGSRLQWDVTKSFYIGVEALYSQLVSASTVTGLVPKTVGLSAPSLCSTGVCTQSDEGNWAFTVRMHKDFLP